MRLSVSFLLLVLFGGSCATEPKVTLQVKLREAFQAKVSEGSGALELLGKLCLLLHLPPGTNVTLHHEGPPHNLTCRA